MPFLNFIELSISGDTNWLIKSGNPQWLEELAEYIQSEYTELSGDKSTNELLQLNAEIAYYEGRIKITKELVAHLRVRRIEGLIDTLRNPEPEGLGYPFMYDDFDTDLRRTELMSKGDEMKLNRAIGARDEITSGDSKKATKKDWFARLAAIDKHRQSPPTNPDNISVLQFIVMDTEFSDYISYLKQQNAQRSY